MLQILLAVVTSSASDMMLSVQEPKRLREAHNPLLPSAAQFVAEVSEPMEGEQENKSARRRVPRHTSHPAEALP